MQKHLISKNEIMEFRKTGKKIVKEWEVSINPAIRWKEIRNKYKQGFNFFIIKMCSWMPPSGLKNWFYRRMGVTIGKNVSISLDVLLDPFYPELIMIEDNVILGWGSVIFTHELTNTKIRIGSVVIRKNSLLGEFSLVRPGTEIGKDSLVAAMSFVNKDVGDYEEVGGIPGHIIKRLKRSDFL
jgi:acetyltransferase-like isoleucine patch superfamily enzyme